MKDHKGVERNLNWKRMPRDKRDFGLRKMFKAPMEALPAKTDLRGFCSKVEDQGDIGSCTGNAVAGALEFLEILNGPETCYVEKSRLFLYYNGRTWWNKRIDSGAFLRDVVKAAKRLGCCNETVWPYVTACFSKCPSRAAYTDGLRNLVLDYAILTETNEGLTLANVKETLARGLPVVFGFDVPQSMMTAETAKTGRVCKPADGEGYVGGHAVLAVGYDDDTQEIIFRNSWSAAWGDGGYGRLPYWYIVSGHASDFIVIRSQSKPEANWWDAVRGSFNWMRAKRAAAFLSHVIVESAAVLCLIFAAGCMTRSITSGTVTAKENQFLMWSNVQGFEIETNGAVRIGSYLTMADTNGMDKVEQMIEKAIAAAVKAGLVAGMMMKEPESEQMTYGRPFRVQRFNGAEGPFDVQIVPIAQDDKMKTKP